MVVRGFERFLSLYFVGTSHACPCCKRSYRKFLSAGNKRRPNARCPGCGSLERHRLLWLFLRNATSLFQSPLKVLHIAPEPYLQETLSSLPNLAYVSADLSSAFAMEMADITHIPHRDSAFDVILCSHVLEHVLDDRAAMSELFRVLNPSGWAILQSPVDTNRESTYEDAKITSPQAREMAFGQCDHVRVYGLDYKDRLERAGFAVQLESYARQLPAKYRERFGIRADEDIWFCTKPAALTGDSRERVPSRP